MCHHARSLRISGATGRCLTYALEGKLRRAFSRSEGKIRLEWTQAVTNESLPSQDCSSLIVKCLRDNHRCNSSDKSRNPESGTRKGKSSAVLTCLPKQTISVASGESFSSEEAKPKE